MAFDGFRPLDDKILVEYLKATPSLAAKLGYQLNDLEIKEVGDGNLKFVYIVIAPSGSFVIKQALPYLRCIGELWPMAKERAYLKLQLCKNMVVCVLIMFPKFTISTGQCV